jgi:hypothetical protein
MSQGYSVHKLPLPRLILFKPENHPGPRVSLGGFGMMCTVARAGIVSLFAVAIPAGAASARTVFDGAWSLAANAALTISRRGSPTDA